MNGSRHPSRRNLLQDVTLAGLLIAGACGPASAQSVRIEPRSFPAIARVDPRFLSYNVEMAEVVGARFWSPYGPPGAPPGDMYKEREPLDLRGNKRLRNMARALGPAYVRVSGTWANSTYFQDDDKPAMKTPAGFKGVLTRAQWAGVVDFAKYVNAKIVTSFPVGPGARNADGTWNAEQTRRWLRYNRSIGGPIAAVEPLNEPGLLWRSDLPRSYTPADFARDNIAFKKIVDQELPKAKFVGPSATADAGFYFYKKRTNEISSEAFLSVPTLPKFDVFAYHWYTGTSERCVPALATPKLEEALTEGWLAEADRVNSFYQDLHKRFAAGTPVWITEIAEAACGGDRWASSFADTFRFVDNAGRLAKGGVSAIFHNTLAASDYALIDDRSWEPRPSYWAAVLWRKLMGETVLDAGASQPNVKVYAQCLRGVPGGVAMVALNLSRDKTAIVNLPIAAERYTLSAGELVSRSVSLNGRPLSLIGDNVPHLNPERVAKGNTALAPTTITFLALPSAHNAACR